MSKAAEALIVPALGESVTEATVAKWLKKPGDAIREDETLVELETDKVTVEVNAPFSGTLTEIKADEGQTVGVGDMLGMVSAGEGGAAVVEAVSAPVTEPVPAPLPVSKVSEPVLSPAVRRIVAEEKLDPSLIPATGKDGRITKEDVLKFLAQTPAPAVVITPQPAEQTPNKVSIHQDNAREERVPMSRLRQTIAKRLKDVQETAAILTTFNEIDMTAVIDLRSRLKDKFEEKYGVKLGFMSFFAKACVEALKEIPAVNSSIDGTDFIYKHYYDIGIAVGAPQGLVVPVVRDVDQKSFAQIEQDIADYARKAQEGKLTVQDMSGGTFTLSNGGTYGSLMSTPILNPPQSGILGMHKTEKRPVVINDKIEIRPMMYVALSYDHRVIDGKEAVTFLVRIKNCIEDPERMLLNV